MSAVVSKKSPTSALLFAALAYLLLAVVYSWPLGARLNNVILGYVGFENTDQTLWLYAEWKAYVIAAARDWIAPHPLSLEHWGGFLWTVMSFSAKLSVANGLDFVFTWPLEAVFGFPAYYNVKCLLLLTLNALALYVLARGLGCRPLAAWVGGAAFAFNPFTYYLLLTGRVIECTLFPLPLYALCLWRAWQDEAGPGWALWAGVWLGVATLVFWFNGHFLLVYTALFAGWQVLVHGRKAWRRLRSLWLILLIALVLVMPAAMPYIVMLGRGQGIPGSARGNTDDDTQRYLFQVRSWSCDLQYGWKPLTTDTQQQGQWNPPWLLPTIHTFDAVLSSFAFLALFVLRPRFRFFIVAFIVLYTLPLGPQLKSDGQVVTVSSHSVLLPYYWLVKWLPLLDHFFFPAESMGLWVMVAATVIALGVERLAEQDVRLLSLGFVVLLLSGIHMRVLDQVPLPLTPVEVPPLYTTSASEGFIYLPANLKFWSGERSPHREFYVEPDLKHVDLHMAMHGRKALWGRNQYLAGKDVWMFQPQSALSNTFMGWLLDVDRQAADKESAWLETDRAQVRAAGFRYLVILERLCCHRAREGDYELDMTGGEELYRNLCQRFEEKFGRAVYDGVDPTWEKYLRPTTVTLHNYRMSIFDMDARP